MKKGRGGAPRRTLASLARGKTIREKAGRVVASVRGLWKALADMDEDPKNTAAVRSYRQALAALSDAPAFAQVELLWDQYLGRPVKPEEEKRELRNTFDEIREVLAHPRDQPLLAVAAENMGKSPSELTALLQHPNVQAARHGSGRNNVRGVREAAIAVMAEMGLGNRSTLRRRLR